MTIAFDVFLSHNSKDKPAVRELAEVLETRGLRVWLDEWQLVPGRPWQQALEEIIRTVPAAAVLIGKDGLGPWEISEMRVCLSQFVRRELPVIPVLLPGAPARPEVPLFLEDLTWVDLRGGLSTEGLDRLEWGITGRKPGGASGAAIAAGEDSGERVHPADGSVLVPVPAGSYPIGAGDLAAASGPLRTVELECFRIGKLPVTNALYRRFLDAEPGRRRPLCWADKRFTHPEQPVVGVSWHDAATYCDWAGLRLPSEIQWEASARGPRGHGFPWGDDEPTADRATFGRTVDTPMPVGTLPAGAGPFGTLEQAGNVREWCADPWTDDPAFRVVRGGAWDDPAWKLRAAYRAWRAAGDRGPTVGFRVALKPE